MSGDADRLPRFYFEGELEAGAHLELPEAIARHVRVLRLRPGERITLFDGRGGEFEATVAIAERSRVKVELGAWRDVEREPPIWVSLVQGISSGERMDLTIQKGVELGVGSIQPVFTEKSVVRLEPQREQSKLLRWRGIAAAACEQCGRNRVPRVHTPMQLSEYCKKPHQANWRFVLAPQAERSLKEVAIGRSPRVVLAAGPEAGLTAAEEAMLVGVGFVPVRLGPRTLRTETAALAALAALNVLQGDF